MQEYLWVGIAVINAVLAFAVWDWYRAFASAESEQSVKGLIPAASIPASSDEEKCQLLQRFEPVYVPFLRLCTVCIAASVIFVVLGIFVSWAVWVGVAFALVAWLPYLWCSVLGNQILTAEPQRDSRDNSVDA